MGPGFCEFAESILLHLKELVTIQVITLNSNYSTLDKNTHHPGVTSYADQDSFIFSEDDLISSLPWRPANCMFLLPLKKIASLISGCAK